VVAAAADVFFSLFPVKMVQNKSIYYIASSCLQRPEIDEPMRTFKDQKVVTQFYSLFHPLVASPALHFPFQHLALRGHE
jgi:hypothetical protein